MPCLSSVVQFGVCVYSVVRASNMYPYFHFLIGGACACITLFVTLNVRIHSHTWSHFVNMLHIAILYTIILLIIEYFSYDDDMENLLVFRMN